MNPTLAYKAFCTNPNASPEILRALFAGFTPPSNPNASPEILRACLAGFIPSAYGKL